MSEVNVEINGRKYRMACEDGQEAHLEGLAERFNAHISTFKGSFGEIGDNRLTVMAGIAVMDDLVEAERQIALLRDELNKLTEAGAEMASQAEAMEVRFTRKLDETARRIEMAVAAVEAAGLEAAKT